MQSRMLGKHLGLAALALLATVTVADQIWAQEATVEEELHVHRLKSGETSPYDAFAYANRINTTLGEGELPVDYAGIVLFSRLPNIEGRIQLKVVKGFDRAAYLGYKSFLRSWPEEGSAVGACVMCHTPASFSDNAEHVADASGTKKTTLTVRNLDKTDAELEAIVRGKLAIAEKAKAGELEADEAYKMMSLTDEDVTNLVSFLKSLKEVPHEEFRNLIVDAEILDTSDML